MIKTQIDYDYEELLEEIAKDEQRLSLEEMNAENIIGLEGSEDDIEESVEGNKTSNGITPKALQKAREEKSITRRAIREEIKQKAFNQKDVNLDKVIGDNLLVELVNRLSDKTDYSVQHLQIANDLVRAMLYSSIPPNLRHFGERYPMAIKKHLGFLYTTTYSEIERKMWFTTDLPAIFQPGDEVSIIRGFVGKKLKNLDYHIEQYFKQQEKLKIVKTKIATSLVHNKVTTHLDLLKLNPEWWDIVYNIIVENKKLSKKK